jgi:hypothetical protein
VVAKLEAAAPDRARTARVRPRRVPQEKKVAGVPESASRVLVIADRDTAGRPVKYGYCCVCGLEFTSHMTMTGRKLYAFLLPAFEKHECAQVRPEWDGTAPCAREGCGHGLTAHPKPRGRPKGARGGKKKPPLLKCTVCGCRHYLEQDGTGPRPTARNADGKYPAEVLTPDEIQAMIKLCSPRAPTGIRNRALLMLLYRSGLRLAEAVGDRAEGVQGIRADDIDWDDHSLRVLHGKGDKATTRFFDVTAEGVLVRWVETRRKLGLRNGPLFCTLDGRPLHPQYVRNLVHRLAAKAGIEKRAHPHGLRHTFAVELVQAGASLDVISRLLGHENIATTAEYLRHLTNADAGRALELIDLPDLDLGDAPRRTLKVLPYEAVDGSTRYRGSCSECGTIFEPGLRVAKRDVRGFLLPAFNEHECREGAPQPVQQPKATASRAPSPAAAPKRAARPSPPPPSQPARANPWGTCAGCGKACAVHLNGTIRRHRVRGSAGMTECEGSGFPPKDELEAAMPVMAELVAMLEDPEEGQKQ